MEGHNSAQPFTPGTSPASPVESSNLPASTSASSANTSTSPTGASTSPELSLPTPSAPKPIQPEYPTPTPPSQPRIRKKNLPHILVIIFLSILAAIVSGAIIYFALHITGVINTINQNSTTLTEEGQEMTSNNNELAVLNSRIETLRNDPEANDGSLEQDLKNYLGKMINKYGNNSNEVYNAAIALSSYYDLFGQYDTAKESLEDRLSLIDNEDVKSNYLASLYRLASEHQNNEDANSYLSQIDGQVASSANDELKAQILINSSWAFYLDNLKYDDEGEVIDGNQEALKKAYNMAMEAEAIHPTAESAILLYYLIRDYGPYLDENISCSMSDKYYKLAHERNPEVYTNWSEEESESDNA